MTTLQAIKDEVMDIIQDSSLGISGTAASGTVTVSGLPSAGETLTVHTQIFTFQSAERADTGEVQIGADEAETAGNIADAVAEDLDWLVGASATGAVVTITASEVGPNFNVALATTAANLTLSGATLAGGVYGRRAIRLINRNYQAVCASMDPLILLPNLDTSAEVLTTSNPYTALPLDYEKHLYRAYSVTRNREVEILGRRDQILDRYTVENLNGPVRHVAAVGANLYYQRIPSDPETLRLYYYKKPTLMTDLAHQPSAIPDPFAEAILVASTLRDLYRMVEDGIEGQKVNTAYWAHEAELEVAKLVDHLGPEKKVPPEFTDDQNLDAMFW